MSVRPTPWTEEDLLGELRRGGAPFLERVRFRENRRTIWSITGGGRRLNLHAAYRRAPAGVVLHFAVLVRELVDGARGGERYRRAARAVKGWPGLRHGVERARRRGRARSRRGRRTGRRREARVGPCCATPAQARWLSELYGCLRGRFHADLPEDLPVRLSRRMTSRLGHMLGSGAAGLAGRRGVVEIALSLDLMLPGNEGELLDTLLHEMAHAEDWLQNGSRGHGPAWKAIARRVGCSDRARCQGPLQRRRHAGATVERVPAVAPGELAGQASATARS